jgi:arylsulfatase A-like enzyme
MPTSRTWRRASFNVVETTVAYAALTNLLTFVRPVLARPIEPNVLAAAVTHVMVFAGVLAGAVLAAAATLLPGVSGDAMGRGRDQVRAASGATGLAVAAIVLAVVAREFILGVCGLAALVFVGFVAARGSKEEVAAADEHWLAWLVPVLVAFVPYVAQARPERNWNSGVLLGVAATALVTVAVAGYLLLFCVRRLASTRVSVAAMLIAMSIGVFGGDLRWGSTFSRNALTIEAAPPPAEPATATAANVVVAVLDTVRADHTSLHGYARNTTPFLKSWWNSGATRYSRAISTSDFTAPSHASILTGLLPSRNGVLPIREPYVSAIDERAETLAERLAKAGWHNVAAVANIHYLDPRFGFARGFHHYDRVAVRMWWGPYRPYFLQAPIQNVASRLLPLEFQAQTASAGEITGRAIDQMRGDAAARRRFFLFLNYMDAHLPYVAPESFRFDAGRHGRDLSWGERYTAMSEAVLSGRRPATGAERHDLEANYDAAIAYIDSELARLIEELRRLGQYDNTLIIITSDHGEMFGESGVVGHHAGTFPELVHVPLVVKYPQQRQSVSIAGVVGLADLVPTILEAVGLPDDRSLDGRPLPTGEKGNPGLAYSESFESAWLAGLNARFRGDERAGFAGPYVYRVQRDGTSATGRWDAEEPAADVPSIPDRPDVFGELRRLAAASAGHRREPVIAPDLMERFRALGYVGR